MGHYLRLPMCARLLHLILFRERPVKISVLCDFLDMLSSSLVIAVRAHATINFHGTVLPRVWLQSTPGLFAESGDYVDGELIIYYIDLVAILLNRLHTGRYIKCLLLDQPRYLTKSIHIARLCQNLAIVGFNLPAPMITARICSVLQSLGATRDAVEPHRLYQRLVFARDWRDVADTVRSNSFGLAVGDLVQLVDHSRLSDTLVPSGNFQRVQYEQPADIPALLFSTLDLQPATAEQDGADSARSTSDAISGIDRPAQHNHNGANVQFSYTPQEQAVLRNAITICISRRRLRSGPPAKVDVLGPLRARHFATFLAQAQVMQWSGPLRSFYRKLYLGPLPHILIALQSAERALHGKKGSVTARLKDVPHLELEGIRAEVQQIDELSRTAVDLQEKLGPRSHVHREADVDGLRELVKSAETFLSIIPADMDPFWEEDLSIGIKGILVRKQSIPPPRRRKPDLQLESDELCN
ncbi:hypothetical protein PsYK624_104020 [Phanerochaete sordida]|uniref:Uncharacterized protein n=1 Tax=Phanerochaete sordida TaxID=48140 RepID=A0A9P3GIJ3_9APHY|nr:hypothetical protein PsYK624_104020 [Phanerochaete sordida]